MKLTKYYQSAFTVATSTGSSVAVDLGSEMPTEMIQGLGTLAGVVISHKHPDHLHIDHLRLIGAPKYGPADVVEDLRGSGLDGVVLNVGESRQIGGFAVTALLSDHGPNISAPIDNLALEFNADGKSLLYLGDMAVATDLPSNKWDVILVPVGGSKVFTPEGALEFLHHLGYEGLVVPIHYHGRADRAAGNKFRDLAGLSLKVRILEVSESLEV